MLATVEHYRPLVLRCTRALKADPQTIEDISQEAMIRVHLHLETLSDEQRVRREELDKIIARMVRNLALNELRSRRGSSKYLATEWRDSCFDPNRYPSQDDQFRDLALKQAAQELLRVLPFFESSILSLLLNPSEQFLEFWRRRQKVREFWSARYQCRYPRTEPLDLEDTALAEFLMITPKRYRRAIQKIQKVARMLLARESVAYAHFTSYLKRKSKFREDSVLTNLTPQDALECFGVAYDPLIPECRKTCQFRFLCKSKVAETIQRIGQDEFQKEFVRICGVNAADTSPQVLELQDFFVKIGLEVVHYAQSVNARLLGYNLFIISRKKSSDFNGLVKFPQVKGLDALPPDVAAALELRDDGKTWACKANNLEDLQSVIASYVRFFRENV